MNTVPLTDEELLEVLFQNHPIGILILDENLRVVQFNPRFAWMLGSAEELLGNSVETLCAYPEDVEGMIRALQSELDRPFVINCKRKQSSPLPVKICAVRNRKHLFLFLEDYGNIHILEEELRYFKTAINSAEDAIFLFDEQGVIFYTNPAYERQVGLPGERIIGTEVSCFWSKQVPPVVYTDLWNSIKGGNTWTGELKCLHSDRSAYEVEVSITPIPNEQKQTIGYICVQRDITQRKDLERKLADYSNNLEHRVEERTEALSKLHEISQLFHRTATLDRRLRLVLIASTAGEGFRFNRAFLLLLDRNKGGLVGRIAIGPSNPEHAGRIWRRVEQLPHYDTISDTLQAYLELEGQADTYVNWVVQQLATPMTHEASLLVQSIKQKRHFIVRNGRTDVDFDESIIHRLGSDHFAVVPLLVQSRPIGVLVVDNAITRQPIGEEDVKMLDILAAQAALAIAHADAMEELAKKVEETERAYSDLRRSQEQLVQSGKFAALGQMAATVAHEIRTPLVSIGGFANMLLKKQDPGDKEYRHLSIIRDEALRLENVLNRLLFYARPSTPVFELHDLNALAQSVLAFMQGEMEYHQVAVVARFAPDLPSIPMDRNLIRQVIVNIIQNGIQSMEKGGTLSVETRLENDWGVLVIQDTGVGIMPEHLNRIYEPFFSTKHSGTGLGLHVSKRIVAGHGGAIQIGSKVSEGTTVTIRLPKRKENF